MNQLFPSPPLPQTNPPSPTYSLCLCPAPIPPPHLHPLTTHPSPTLQSLTLPTSPTPPGPAPLTPTPQPLPPPAGEQLSEQQEAELLAWWQQPVPFPEAQQAWSSYLAAAGMPHGPRLEEVILADQKARAKGAAGAGEEAGRVQAVSEQLREVFEAFAARHGSTLYGSGGSTGPGSTATSGETPSSSGGVGGTSETSGAGGAGGSWGGDLSWDEVQRLNAGLDVTSGEALASSFSAPSLRDVLRRHWQDTARTFLPAASAAAGSGEGVDSAAAPAPDSLRSFEDLWQLMLQVYDTTLSQAGASTSDPTATASASTPAAAAGSSGSGSTGGVVHAAAQGADGVLSRAEQQWGPYVDDMAGRASAVHTVPGSPPYPGASRGGDVEQPGGQGRGEDVENGVCNSAFPLLPCFSTASSIAPMTSKERCAPCVRTCTLTPVPPL